MITWKDFITHESEQPYFYALKNLLTDKYKQGNVFPPKDKIMNAFKLCPLDQVKVIILGQDPYPTLGNANGLAFSVNDGVEPPPSLKNIFKEIEDSLLVKCQESGNLERWARQGVLLINSVMTVDEGKPGSHANIGWQTFTDSAIKAVSDNLDNVVFMFWGNYAGKKEVFVDSKKHVILKAPHPSPLSAHRGFLGCDHFHMANTYLTMSGKSGINWQ